MKSDDSTFGYVSVNALMEFARNHVDRKVDCNDIARFPRSNVRNADEQQSLQQIFGIPFARLRELAEAEKDGRVVVLPCKVGTPVFFIRILCEHADDFGYCNTDYWYAKRGFKRESGCVNCPKMNLKPRLKETVFRLALMDEKRAGHLHVSEIFFDRAEAERALSSANEPADRCSTCENNGKPICSSCIMTGHGNDIDFYRVATESKGEATT